MSRLNPQHIKIGETVQVAGPTDREAYIRQTLERLRNDKIAQAEAEVANILEQARTEASALIEDAKTQAKAIVASGEEQKEQAYSEGVQQGHTQGYEDGYREGREQAEDDTETLLLATNILIERAYQAQHQVLSAFTPQAANLLRAILQQALHNTLNNFDNTQWENLLTKILGELTESSQYRLVVSAGAYKQFKELSPRIAKTFDDTTRLVVDVDDQLAVHEMYVISDEGTVDISPGSQAEELLKAVVPQLGITEISPETINPDDETQQLNSLREGFFNQYQQRHMPQPQQPEGETTDPEAEAPTEQPPVAEPIEAPAPQANTDDLPTAINEPPVAQPEQPEASPPTDTASDNALPELPSMPNTAEQPSLPSDPLDNLETPPTALNDLDGLGDFDDDLDTL